MAEIIDWSESPISDPKEIHNFLNGGIKATVMEIGEPIITLGNSGFPRTVQPPISPTPENFWSETRVDLLTNLRELCGGDIPDSIIYGGPPIYQEPGSISFPNYAVELNNLLDLDIDPRNLTQIDGASATFGAALYKAAEKPNLNHLIVCAGLPSKLTETYDRNIFGHQIIAIFIKAGVVSLALAEYQDSQDSYGHLAYDRFNIQAKRGNLFVPSAISLPNTSNIYGSLFHGSLDDEVGSNVIGINYPKSNSTDASEAEIKVSPNIAKVLIPAAIQSFHKVVGTLNKYNLLQNLYPIIIGHTGSIRIEQLLKGWFNREFPELNLNFVGKTNPAGNTIDAHAAYNLITHLYELQKLGRTTEITDDRVVALLTLTGASANFHLFRFRLHT